MAGVTNDPVPSFVLQPPETAVDSDKVLDQYKKGKGWFPMKCFCCCPKMVSVMIPDTWKKIQDMTHLVLVIGVCSGIILVVMSLLSLMAGVGCQHASWCLLSRYLFAPLTIAFAVPVVSYVLSIIKQYDEELQAKQKNVKEEKENLIRAYQGIIEDMDSLLAKSTESASGLAERSFESKRKDFVRFIGRVKSRFTIATKIEPDVLNQFRKFCLNWLKVFAECSIDPINHPRVIVKEEEMMRCCDVNEIADLCLNRLKVTEVKFISNQRNQDERLMQKNRSTFKRITVEGRALAIEDDDSEDVPPRRIAAEVATPIAGTAEVRRHRTSWFKCGGGYGCKVKSYSLQESFPKEFSFGCGRVVLLSKQHAHIFFQFIFGWTLVGFKVFLQFRSEAEQTTEGEESPGGLSGFTLMLFACILLTQMCVYTLLSKFEDIDLIQQLEREIQELKTHNENVATEQDKMKDFWGRCNQLSELWLYRTVPRLDLYQELHSKLEDGADQDLHEHLAGANSMLQDLESVLGKLEAWQTDGVLDIDDKRAFGKKMNALCQEDQLDQVLVKIEEVISGEAMQRFKALPAA